MYLLKYDKKLINDYIMGNDILDYNIEHLEDNADFMREVLLTTKDPKMYYMCSDKLKINYEFILFFIELFVNEEKIVNDVIVNYFKLINSDIKRKEFELSLAKLSMKYKNNYLQKYQSLVINIYSMEMNEYKNVISRVSNNEWKKYYGMGFFFVVDRYSSSELIQNFFAQSLLDGIFLDYKLETELHRTFMNSNEVEKYGINKFILKIVNNYDMHLANYLAVNPDLMAEIYKKIKYYIRKWDNYDLNLADEVLGQIDRYFVKKSKKRLLLQEEVVVYIVKKLNLQRIFNKSDIYQNELEVVTNLSKNRASIDENNLPVPEMITLYEVENIIKREVLGEKEVACGDTKKLIKVDFRKNK